MYFIILSAHRITDNIEKCENTAASHLKASGIHITTLQKHAENAKKCMKHSQNVSLVGHIHVHVAGSRVSEIKPGDDLLVWMSRAALRHSGPKDPGKGILGCVQVPLESNRTAPCATARFQTGLASVSTLKEISRIPGNPDRFRVIFGKWRKKSGKIQE